MLPISPALSLIKGKFLHSAVSSHHDRFKSFTFYFLTDLFTQTPSRLLWKASSHMLQLMREGCSYTYPPLSIVRYLCIQLSELEQCRVNKLAQGFNTAAQDSNPGSRSRESEALTLSHCAIRSSSSSIFPVTQCFINYVVNKSTYSHPICVCKSLIPKL